MPIGVSSLSKSFEAIKSGTLKIGSTWIRRFMALEKTTETSLVCLANCSGHGECMNGTCFCEVQYDGDGCSEPNVSYHAAFASVFLLVAVTSLIQLFVCVHSEYSRMKTPSIVRACRITTQKLLYFLICLAALLRGLYFAYPAVTDKWTANLLSAYYPVLLTGASLVVCFWAEVFHLRDVQDGSRFLSKSFLGFLMFNVITYSLLVAELVLTNTAATNEAEKSFYSHIFGGCYAALMFIVVIFFLIYGVEVYFKVRGGFLIDLDETIELSVPLNSQSGSQQEKNETSNGRLDLHEELKNNQVIPGFERTVDTAQLHQSRFGLISQAAMLIITVCFLLSDILGEFWKYKVPLGSRNTHDVVFRLVELGVALWFPCVLWNCMRPEQLWILNPKKILKHLEVGTTMQDSRRTPYSTEAKVDDASWDKGPDCWICYDNERTDAGPMIYPCSCKGDVSAVHHECLRRWLVESVNNPSALTCKVCQTPYHVQKSEHSSWNQLAYALTPRRWMQTAAIVTLMCCSIGGATAVVQIYQDSGIRLLAVGLALLVVYVCCRFLGLNTVLAYQRSKVSAFNIVSRIETTPVATISQMVTVEAASVEPGLPERV